MHICHNIFTAWFSEVSATGPIISSVCVCVCVGGGGGEVNFEGRTDKKADLIKGE